MVEPGKGVVTSVTFNLSVARGCLCLTHLWKIKINTTHVVPTRTGAITISHKSQNKAMYYLYMRAIYHQTNILIGLPRKTDSCNPIKSYQISDFLFEFQLSAVIYREGNFCHITGNFVTCSLIFWANCAMFMCLITKLILI